MPKMKLIITAVLIFHGVGQLMGILPVFHFLKSDTPDAPSWAKNWSSRSWLLGKTLGEIGSKVLCFILYFAAFLLFTAAAMALNGWVFSESAWVTFAFIGAVVSATALALFWHGLIMLFPHKIGDIAVNFAVLSGILRNLIDKGSSG
jgi:hypothetical protein